MDTTHRVPRERRVHPCLQASSRRLASEDDSPVASMTTVAMPLDKEVICTRFAALRSAGRRGKRRSKTVAVSIDWKGRAVSWRGSCDLVLV